MPCVLARGDPFDLAQGRLFAPPAALRMTSPEENHHSSKMSRQRALSFFATRRFYGTDNWMPWLLLSLPEVAVTVML